MNGGQEAGGGAAGKEAGSPASPAGETGDLGGAVATASPAADGPVAAGGALRPQASAITPPRVITVGRMDYPPDAFRLTVRRRDLGSALAIEGAEGAVGVRALVLVDGTVGGVEVVASSGSAALDRAAAAAVRRWSFAPATRDGVPIDAYVMLKVRYVVR